MYYDMMKEDLIDDDVELVEKFIYQSFLTLNGERLSKATINTCLKEYRSEKRTKGKNRINVSKYN